MRIALVLLFCLFAVPVFAHFQMIIPSDDIVTQSEKRELSINAMFWHPFEGHGMNMVLPAKFGVLVGGKQTDLLKSLKPKQVKDRRGKSFQTFTLNYTLKRPGDYVFYLQPKPYWDETEESFIVHYTKVIVNGFGLEEGWDQDVGLKTEITPLTRPYGIYTGNVFQGIVKLDGEPVAFSKVEVEYFNEQGKLQAPAGPYITQVVKTDSNGVFTYAMPKAGWWGIAALNSAKEKMLHKGKKYPVELGAVLWINTHDMPN